MGKAYELYEMKCTDCEEYALIDVNRDELVCCPYCGEDLDYAPGEIYPVISYIAGERKVRKM